MTHNRDATQEIAQWEVESLRLTTFHTPGIVSTDSTDWWESVLGDKPERVTTWPKENRTQQSGTFDGGQLALIFRIDRVDWILRGMMGAPGVPVEGPPNLGTLRDALESLLTVAQRWLDVCPDLTRLAFGAALVETVEDLNLAYQKMSTMLPYVNVGEADSPDFLYQINRPRISKSPTTIKINRLSKWSVIQGGDISIVIGQGAAPTLASEPHFACRLDLDINTSPESSTVIPKGHTWALFSEMVDLGIEIADNGDIP